MDIYRIGEISRVALSCLSYGKSRAGFFILSTSLGNITGNRYPFLIISAILPFFSHVRRGNGRHYLVYKTLVLLFKLLPFVYKLFPLALSLLLLSLPSALDVNLIIVEHSLLVSACLFAFVVPLQQGFVKKMSQSAWKEVWFTWCGMS
jgi:hypothetical protein